MYATLLMYTEGEIKTQLNVVFQYPKSVLSFMCGYTCEFVWEIFF